METNATPASALEAFVARDFSRAQQDILSLKERASPEAKPRLLCNVEVLKFYTHGRHEDIEDLVASVALAVKPEQKVLPGGMNAFFDETVKDPAALKRIHAVLGPVPLFNVAVLAYQTGRIEAAANIGAVLYASVEGMEDWLALRTCFLLIDVYLRWGDIAQATTAAAYAERLIPGFTRETAQSGAIGAHDVGAGPSSSPPAPPSSELIAVTPHWSERHSAVLETPASFEDAKFCMHVYNARLSEIADGTRSLRKEAKSAVLAAGDAASRPTAAALLVKARVEPSVQKGLRILASIGNQAPPDVMRKIRPLALNSLGVLHHRLGRHALSASYFELARTAFATLFGDMHTSDTGGNDAASADSRDSLSILWSTADSHVSYNLALQYMMLSKFRDALIMFSACARRDQVLSTHSAQLWIRMAECCIGEENAAQNEAQVLKVHGHGRGRRMVLCSSHQPDVLLMQYAGTCARAALSILDQRAQKRPAGSRHAAEDTPKPAIFEQLDDMQLRRAALALLSYATLHFDASDAVVACDELVNACSGIDSDREVLGRLYGAEALCMLGRANDAADRLAPLLAMNVSADSSIRDAAFVNVALAHAMHGDLTTATRAAKAALKVSSGSGQKASLRREASLVASYVFLRGGEAESARQILRALSASM